MDTNITVAPKAIAAVPFVAEAQRVADQKVPVVKELDGTPVLPADKVFVAQVVTARLSGTIFPENPAEIAPPERTLRPYDIPMLPADKEEPVFGGEEAEQFEEEKNSDELPDQYVQFSEETNPLPMLRADAEPAEPEADKARDNPFASFGENEPARVADS